MRRRSADSNLCAPYGLVFRPLVYAFFSFGALRKSTMTKPTAAAIKKAVENIPF